MTKKKHEKLGIKQTIQIDWMNRVVQMLLSGMNETEIRNDLDSFLSTQKQSGGIGERGKKTYGIAISILSSWFTRDKELKKFCNTALDLAKTLQPADWLPLHWAVISASYPFWFNTAKQVGRILNLQDKIAQRQIFDRLKEQYGDRETVARNARYTVRSFVAWNTLKDSDKKGCYEKTEPYIIQNSDIAVLLYEAALHTTQDGKAALGLLTNNPGFFPFQLPKLTGDYIAHNCKRIDVIHHGFDDEILKLVL
ncbi:Uncharacterized protein dnl_15330 [Desulfonema limicola]|uniref:Uncharacterized protein n=1 Tax=Desulfonema limicola TaxID=45656 RepID=A0A975GFK2_9BACT|nr:hypothetical protein [Desulfonema limicola]QTA79275.1 Uncharacterized protein dnl_15330 [Desulfonema limicola]